MPPTSGCRSVLGSSGSLVPAHSTGDAHLVVRHGLLHHDLEGLHRGQLRRLGHDEGGRDELQDGHPRCYGPAAAAPRTLRPTCNHWLGITTPCCRSRCPCQRGGAAGEKLQSALRSYTNSRYAWEVALLLGKLQCCLGSCNWAQVPLGSTMFPLEVVICPHF